MDFLYNSSVRAIFFLLGEVTVHGKDCKMEVHCDYLFFMSPSIEELLDPAKPLRAAKLIAG